MKNRLKYFNKETLLQEVFRCEEAEIILTDERSIFDTELDLDKKAEVYT